MASAVPPPTTSFYGPISPAILGFDWDDDEQQPSQPRLQLEEQTQLRQQQTQQHQQHQQQQLRQQLPKPPSALTTPNLRSVVLDFWGFNAALLENLFDDEASEISGMATDGGSVAGDNVAPTDGNLAENPTPVSRTGVADFATSTILGEHQNREKRVSGPSEALRPRDMSANGSESGRSYNPYDVAIENKQNAMTVAFLRSPRKTGAVDASSALGPDDLSFGQRYKVSTETSKVTITNQRRLPDILSGDRECIICTDTKPVSDFPAVAITKACAHEPTTCLACVATSIRTDLNSRLWNEIKCPECRATLEYDDVQRFADEETKERYQNLSFRSAISSSPAFLWCTAGCGYGQVHEGGASSPIVTCRLCSQRSCFHHKVAWHENLTCDEYDSLLADPANFRSQFDVANEEAERAAAARRAQEDADRVFAQSLIAEERRAVAEERAERERKEERDKREREMREAAMRRKREEEASSRTVGSTTKPCPGCNAPIEKNAGWCKHEFCWDCLASHKQILERDNSAHKEICPWHPNNIKD
ncbi:hypothetical protein P885DRAFT_36033 [Corynascus similis CBS 632.67]